MLSEFSQSRACWFLKSQVSTFLVLRTQNSVPFTFKVKNYGESYSLCGLHSVIVCLSPFSSPPVPPNHRWPGSVLLPNHIFAHIQWSLLSIFIFGVFSAILQSFSGLFVLMCYVVVFVGGGKLRVLLLYHLSNLLISVSSN